MASIRGDGIMNLRLEMHEVQTIVENYLAVKFNLDPQDVTTEAWYDDSNDEVDLDDYVLEVNVDEKEKPVPLQYTLRGSSDSEPFTSF